MLVTGHVYVCTYVCTRKVRVLYKFPLQCSVRHPVFFFCWSSISIGEIPFFYPCIFPVSVRARGIGKNSSNLSHNVRAPSPRWFSRVCQRLKNRIFFFCVFSSSVHRPWRSANGGGKKKAIRNIACPSISGRMVTDVWWRIYFICQTLGHRWTENSSNVNRNILKQCLHGNN